MNLQEARRKQCGQWGLGEVTNQPHIQSLSMKNHKGSTGIVGAPMPAGTALQKASSLEQIS